MGKGDKRTTKGKISAGSYGKTRPKHKKAAHVPKEGEAPVKKGRKTKA